MNQESKNTFKGAVIVTLGLVVTLIPFSLLIGWNLLTLILFWFILLPGLSLFLPTVVSRNKNHLFESLTGLMIFYAIMVFMIYDHFQTDYFQAMILSCLFNVLVVSIFALPSGKKKHV